MNHDRRQGARHPRLLRMTFDWEGDTYQAVTTDISAAGAFLNTIVYPTDGTVLELVHTVGDASVRFAAVVRRVVDPLSRISVVPGIGVSWMRIWTRGSAAGLTKELEGIFKQPVKVDAESGPDGRVAVWTPGARSPISSAATRLADVRADLRQLEDVRPPIEGRTGPLPRVGTAVERRATPRAEIGAEVTFYANRIPLAGRVRDLSLRGMWVVSSDGTLPQVGDVVTCRYPLPDADQLRWARLVGVVIRSLGGRAPGFAVEIIRIDNLGQSHAFESYIDRQTALARGPASKHRPVPQRQLHAVPSD